jgi:hypothetical protein
VRAAHAHYRPWPFHCGPTPEYDRLIDARHQTEAAYLEGYDRDLVRDLEASEPELEAEP